MRDVTECAAESAQQCSNSLVVHTGQEARHSSIVCFACVRLCFRMTVRMCTRPQQPAAAVQYQNLVSVCELLRAVSKHSKGRWEPRVPPAITITSAAEPADHLL